MRFWTALTVGCIRILLCKCVRKYKLQKYMLALERLSVRIYNNSKTAESRLWSFILASSTGICRCFPTAVSGTLHEDLACISVSRTAELGNPQPRRHLRDHWGIPDCDITGAILKDQRLDPGNGQNYYIIWTFLTAVVFYCPVWVQIFWRVDQWVLLIL